MHESFNRGLTDTHASINNPIRGELVPGVDCYILGPDLDDHRVSKRAVLTALTLGAKHAKSDRYIERIPAQILADVGLDPSGPNIVQVNLPDQPTAHTYSATDFVKILTAYSKWLASGTMRKDQEHLGRNAAGVLATFAATGVVMAIRKACGLSESIPSQNTLANAEQILASLATASAAIAENQRFINGMLNKHESRLDTIERQLSQPAPDPLAERRALEAEAKRREISEKRREAGRKGGLVTAERYRRDPHGRFAPKASAPPRPPTQTKIPLAPPLPAPSQSGPPGQVQIVQRKVEGEPDLVRAARIASELAQPFYRYEFSIAMWPLDPYNPRRCDMVLERLQGDGQVEPVQRRTNGGSTTTCYLYTGEGTARRVA